MSDATTCAKCGETYEEYRGECKNCVRIEHRRIIIELDIEAVSPLIVPGTSKEVRLVGLHMCRYEFTDIPAELRHASGEWLRSRGHSSFGGLPLLPLGELP